MTAIKTLTDTAILSMQWGLLETARSAKRDSDHRRLALFAWSLPPSTNTGVHRPLSFLRYGPGLGWQIDAFCSDPPPNQREHGEHLLKLIPEGSRIHVVPEPERTPSYRLFPRVDGGFRLAIAYARAAIRTMRDAPPTVVMASGPPFFSFVAALFTARYFRVPVVLDYRDEWTECPADFVDKSGNDLWWERRCLRHASQVVYATSGLMQHALKTFPELRPQTTHHIANGWEPENFTGAAAAADSAFPAEGELIRIAHVGILVQHTPPEPLLASLKELVAQSPDWRTRLRFRLIGRRSTAADAAIRAFPHQEMLEIIDHVSKSDATAYMQESDVLLVISMPDLARAMPSKLIEYLAARKPILVFGSEGDPAELVERLQVGVLCKSGSGAELARALERLTRVSYQQRKLEVDAWLSTHQRKALAARLFDLLDKTVAAAKTGPAASA